MAHLVPYPFGLLVRRMLRELEQSRAIFDLPERKFFRGDAALDFSVRYAGHTAGSPLGPVAGPHTQMAQNLVLAWLGGARILELKTVQVMDDLEIPRPCIDMRTVGYNVEWSQELTVPESLAEYVKGAMLITILRDGGYVPQEAGFRPVIFDMSLGYDLAGIQSEKVQGFVRGMRDAGELIEKLRWEIPAEYAHLRDLEFPRDLSDTITLSTFHGCPPGEIERIVDSLMTECGLNTVVKFNPMLLGKTEVRRVLNEELGYAHLSVPDAAFDRDVPWPMALEMMERLAGRAESAGVTLGAKFSNTLVVENNTGFLPADQREAYLSGPPLHVLATRLVQRFRDVFGDRFPVSFSAGVDRANFPDLAALGLKPVTVCTDLLKTGGYGRLEAYYRELKSRMAAVGAVSLDDFVLKAYGRAEAALAALDRPAGDARHAAGRSALAAGGDLRAAVGPEVYARWLGEARRLNSAEYTARVAANSRYALGANSQPPRKIGSTLELFDCVSCDKCVPVCPNDANFTFPTIRAELPVVSLERAGQGWSWRQERVLHLTEKHQIGTFADFCNECGNCDVFCPEDGGPYKVKPNFFGSHAAFEAARPHAGIAIEKRPGGARVFGRQGGHEYRLDVVEDRHAFRGPDFEVRFRADDPAGTFQVIAAPPTGPLDLTWCFILDNIRLGVLAGTPVNYLSNLPELIRGDT